MLIVLRLQSTLEHMRHYQLINQEINQYFMHINFCVTVSSIDADAYNHAMNFVISMILVVFSQYAHRFISKDGLVATGAYI